MRDAVKRVASCKVVSFHEKVRVADWALTAVALLASQVAHANFSCTGPVSYLAVDANATVWVRVSGYGTWAVCNLGSASSSGGATVYTEACRARYASLLANQKSGHSVTLYFTSSSTDSSLCSKARW
jgi:hypothetical protein